MGYLRLLTIAVICVGLINSLAQAKSRSKKDGDNSDVNLRDVEEGHVNSSHHSHNHHHNGSDHGDSIGHNDSDPIHSDLSPLDPGSSDHKHSNHGESDPKLAGSADPKLAGSADPKLAGSVDWDTTFVYDPLTELTDPTPTRMEAEILEAKLYLMRIFNKYGEGGKMSFEGFEHLLANLGIGHVRIEDHDIHDHYSKDGSFKELHPDHDHNNRTGIGKKGKKHHHDDHEDQDHESHGLDHENHDLEHNDHDLDPDLDTDKHKQGHDHHNRNNPNGGHLSNREVHLGDDLEHESRDLDSGKAGESSTSVQELSPDRPPNANVSLANSTAVDVNRTVIAADVNRTATSPEGSTGPNHHRSQRALGEKDFAHINHGHVEKKCLTTREILLTYEIQYEGGISKANLMNLCPAIIYQIDEHACAKPPPCPTFHEDREYHCKGYHDELARNHSHGHHGKHGNHSDDDGVEKLSLLDHFWKVSGKVWGFAILSVTIISLVGLLSVAVIPIMNKVFYNHLLQFLVALAIGSLTGDALLHLIPHALEAPHDSHDDHGSLGDHGEDGGHSKDGIYKGVVALAGIYSFFIMERVMGMFSEWKRNRRKKKRAPPPSIFRNDLDEIGQKLSKHNDQYASCADFMMVVHPSKAVKKMAEEAHEELKELKSCEDTSHGGHHDDSHSNGGCRDDKHGDKGHGHSHGGHGHSHGVPTSVSSVAWMVVMGDGLHNFTDGLAIGASFSTGMSAGLSTSVAVFCHELPHELGDFAVLLRAGMSVKQALVYNIVSSVLCFVGMVIGVFVGNIASASQWVFALTAGIFIYISLVDMLPEITAIEVAKQKSKCCHLLLQCLGISLGVGVMLLIALFEDKIRLNIGDDVV